MNKPRILFLCTGNSCRSQMAEGLARELKGGEVEAFSAGTRPQGLNRNAVEVMHELGIDISGHTSKSVDELIDVAFDYVVIVCSDAQDSCPVWPGRGILLYRGFDDPPRLAVNSSSDEEALEHYRRVRDEIKEFVLTLPGALKRQES